MMKLHCSAIVWATAIFAPSFAFIHPIKTRFGIPTQRSSSLLRMVADDAKVVLITGASQGLGQAIAYEMAKHGQKVVVDYIEGCEEGAQETVEHVKALGGDAVAIAADCSQPSQVMNLFDKAIEHYGEVDVLINNAGITRDNLVLRMKPADWEMVLNVNLSGVFYCSQEFFRRAVENNQSGGRVINIASVVGQIGNPGQANYAASKAAVIGLTKSFAKEFGSSGFKVNAVCPGFIATKMTEKLGEEMLETVRKSIPLQRLGKPEEVAAMTRFLALDEGADYITGHCFDVDGGVGIAAA